MAMEWMRKSLIRIAKIRPISPMKISEYEVGEEVGQNESNNHAYDS